MLNSHIIKEGHPKWHWFFSAPCTMTRTCHPTKGYYEGNVVLFAMFNHCVAKPYCSTKQNRFSWLMIEVLGILGWCFCISGQPIPYLPLRHVLELRYKCTKTRAASQRYAAAYPPSLSSTSDFIQGVTVQTKKINANELSAKYWSIIFLMLILPNS